LFGRVRDELFAFFSCIGLAVVGLSGVSSKSHPGCLSGVLSTPLRSLFPLVLFLARTGAVDDYPPLGPFATCVFRDSGGLFSP